MQKLFSLTYLNNKVKAFDYGTIAVISSRTPVCAGKDIRLAALGVFSEGKSG